LRMKRRDIADYLGLKIETVSRVLTWLESRAAIELPSLNRIVLCNHSVLRAAMEDCSNGALSSSHVEKNTARKRLDRRLASTRVRQRVLPEAVLGRG
jgi:hypothetical protein